MSKIYFSHYLAYPVILSIKPFLILQMTLTLVTDPQSWKELVIMWMSSEESPPQIYPHYQYVRKQGVTI